MGNVVVRAGQSLWSIARDRLGAGASDADVSLAVRKIAAANGLSASAGLERHQTLVMPDVFDAAPREGEASIDAFARLSAGNIAPGPLATRLSPTLPPVVQHEARFSSTTSVPVGAVDLPPIAGIRPRGEVRAFQGVKSFVHASAFETVDAALGKLTRERFDAVHAELGGRSRVRFDPAREYRVRDFLPPALQALVDKDLEIPPSTKLPGTQKLVEDFNMDPRDLEVGLTMNCHAAAWEGARAYQGQNDEQVAVFYGEMVTLDGLVEGGATFETIGKVPASRLDDVNQLDLRPGDIVQFHEDGDMARMTLLLHSAVYVGGGLFFEKPNTEGHEKEDPERYIPQEETPFRLTTLAGMASPVSDAVDGRFTLHVLRPRGPLEDPAKVFASSLAEPLERWAKEKGRPLGVELVSELEQGMAGGIRGEHVSALVRVGLVQRDDGTSVLAE